MSKDDLITLRSRAEITRRDTLKLLAGGIAALSAGCTARPGADVLPYVDEPEQHPGTPVRYATALTLGGFATGALVTTREGRPIKIDGNPQHPASLGGSTPWMQAAVLDLYDPARIAGARRSGLPTSLAAEIARLAAGTGPLWLVLPPQSSPAVAALLARIAERRELHVVCDAPIDHRSAYRGHALVCGEPLEQQVDTGAADVIVALDADWTAMPAWARRAAAKRAPRCTSRWWTFEPMPTPTGTASDHRVPVAAGRIAAVAVVALARLATQPVPAELVRRARELLGPSVRLVEMMADDLNAQRGRGAVIVGDRQPAAVHALGALLCGATTVTYTAPVLADALDTQHLADALAAGAVETLVIADCNPVLAAPQLAQHIAHVPVTVWAGLHRDESARACAVELPLAHALEAWGDACSRDGTRAIVQPVIERRFPVVSVLELCAALAGETAPARALVQGPLADAEWRRALARGVAGDPLPPKPVTPAWSAALAGEVSRVLAAGNAPIEIALAPSQIGEGRFAHNAWLQELPHPITKQTWGNAALMSPATAAHLNIVDEDVVAVRTQAGALELPALVVAGHADDAVTIELGYGRVLDGSIADGLGGNGHVLGGGLVFAGRVAATGRRAALARAQTSFTRADREVAIPLEEVARYRGAQPSRLPEHAARSPQWAMSIDTSLCTSCGACVVACQAENNIPAVGPAEVARGRGMHWLRIDTYVERDEYTHEPMACQHCEHAPCEYVCPVGATSHSPDGLNEQTYNRCIGTRFCSNNCPYKVRKFNFFNHDRPGLQYNPDVTVRARGVMEKCTYCVQRIRRAEQVARVEDRAIAPGEVVTACQEACSTGAIQFGALGERGPLAAMREDPRRYEALHGLGTRPRTQYLAKLRNRKAGA